jgi:VanZ family protein
MQHTHSTTQRSWLLFARGILYMLIGGSMFIFASSYSAQSGHIIGSLAVLAGICQLLYSFSKNSLVKNNFWGILHGITDVGFGIAIFLFSNGTIKSFVDVLGFWAMMYAFLQAVQAMYAFMAARGGRGTVPNTSFIHFANVLVAGGLTFTLLLRPAGFDDSLNFIGLFPILLGVLIILLTRQMRESADRSY